MIRGTILVLDDDHDIRVCMRDVLEDAGYAVESATDGASALQVLARIPAPDLILLDMNMPVMNGDEFLEVIRGKPELRSVPIIQISAGNTPRRDGVRGYLKKPFGIDDLLGAVDSVLKAQGG